MSRFSSKQLLPLQKKSSVVFSGAVQCQQIRPSGQPCPNQAYYEQGGSYRCGHHSKAGLRTNLPKDKSKEQEKMEKLRQHRLGIARVIERSNGARGGLRCYGMAMMQSVPLVSGWLNVFPNNKHQDRADGFGCASLSPMQLGPVAHRQPGLPPALNIENYHQFNKVFPCEVVPRRKDQPPKPEFFALQLKAYQDPVPHRHKFDAKKMKQQTTTTGENRNVPLYSLHLDLKGEQRRFTYVQSRYFYCRAYETLAKQTQDFAKLTALLESGCNVIICGYDGRSVPVDTKTASVDEVVQVMDRLYYDETRPFGHELVLYCLLVIAESENYPWNRYRAQYSDIYDNIAHVL